jgi:hypothetical protein
MPDYPQLLKKTICELITDLKENIFVQPDEQADLGQVEFFFSLLDEKELMKHVIENTMPFAQHIRNRDMTYFISQKNRIFEGLPEDRINHFEHLIITPEEHGGMSNENRDAIWDYFGVIVDIAEKYKKTQ